MKISVFEQQKDAESLGDALIPLTDGVSAQPFDKWYPLSKGGELHLRVHCRAEGDEKTELSLECEKLKAFVKDEKGDLEALKSKPRSSVVDTEILFCEARIKAWESKIERLEPKNSSPLFIKAQSTVQLDLGETESKELAEARKELEREEEEKFLNETYASTFAGDAKQKHIYEAQVKRSEKRIEELKKRIALLEKK